MYLDSCFLLNERTPGSSAFPGDRLWQRYGGYPTPPARFACLGMVTAPFVDQFAMSPPHVPSGRFNRQPQAPARGVDGRRGGLVKVLVTGGAGFIGSNLVRSLVERGDDLRVLDKFSTGNRANLEGVEAEVVEGELRSYERVHNAVRDIEVVYHLGALGSVPRSVQDPLTSNAVNVEGTLNVLLAARDSGVRRVVFCLELVDLRQRRPAARDRGHAAEPDLAVRRRQARRGALLHRVTRVYDGLRDGGAALFQRLRPSAEPVLAVRGDGAALPHRGHARRARDDRRRRRAIARLHLRRGMSVDATLRAADVPRRQRARLQRRRPARRRR